MNTRFQNMVCGPARQRGYATLTIGIILLVALTFITLFAARVGVVEQQISANERRAQQALAAGETGVEQGFGYLRASRKHVTTTWDTNNDWVACTDANTAIPCGDGTANLYGPSSSIPMLAYSNIHNVTDADGNLVVTQPAAGNGTYELHFLTPDNGGAPYERPPVMVLARGLSDDGTGEALVRQVVAGFPFKADVPHAPIIAAGEIDGSGTFEIVPNPNAGGPGVALSAWSNNDFLISGALRTCHVGDHLLTKSNVDTFVDKTCEGETVQLCRSCDCDFVGNNVMGVSALSDSSIENYDILDNEANAGVPADGVNPDTTNFPSDLFEYVFGVPTADYLSIKNEAPPQLKSDCTDLVAQGTAASGLWWITGNCALGATDIGSYETPVLLVVEGDLTANGNSQIFGLLFSFSPNAGTKLVRLNGGPIVYGSIISNGEIDLANGNFTMRYEACVLANVGAGLAGAAMAKIPGSWADYL